MVWQALQGVFRSLRLYHGRDAPKARMDALYARYVQPGDLVIDVGAHVGDRVSSFRRLQARVVALEPQPLLLRALHLIHGRDQGVTILPAVAAADAGSKVTLSCQQCQSDRIDTVFNSFVRSASTEGWEGELWDRALDVPATKLDDLIQRSVLRRLLKSTSRGLRTKCCGLSQCVPALSFKTRPSPAMRAALPAGPERTWPVSL